MPLPINTVIKYFYQPSQANEEFNGLELTQKEHWTNELSIDIKKEEAIKIEDKITQIPIPYSPHKIN